MGNSPIVNRINALLAEKGISKKEFYEACGITSASYSLWNTGKTTPKKKNLETISVFLNTTVEYLLTGLGEKEKSPSEAGEGEKGESIEEIKAAFWGGEKDLSKEDWDEMWDDVETFAKFRAEQQRRKKNGVTD